MPIDPIDWLDKVSDELRKKMLEVFSKEEFEHLSTCYDEAENFIGIGFTNQFGQFTQYADPKKVEVVLLLEDKYRQDLDKKHYDRIISEELQRRFHNYTRTSVYADSPVHLEFDDDGRLHVS